ncbi:MAG: hypothetical protein ACRD8A_14945, partial [Candidatus Acidiferrales bacterium]
MRRTLIIAGRAIVIFLLLVAGIAAIAGRIIGPSVLHPANPNPQRFPQTAAMLRATATRKEDFTVRAPDGVELRGWKIRAAQPNGDWVLLFHGMSDDRTGMLGPAEFLLLHGYS